MKIEHIGQYLRDIYFGEQAGQLNFHYEKTQKYLFFHRGSLVYARTNNPEELLGEVLFRLGKITEDVYRRIDEYILPKKSIGEVLIGNNLLTNADLKDGLIHQMREITLNMFSFFGEGFRFQKKAQLTDETFDAEIKIPVLIEDGIRRMKYDDQLQNYMRGATIYLKEKEFYFRLTEEEKDIYENIQGESRTDDLEVKYGQNHVLLWKSLYLFYCLNLIDIKGIGRSGATRPETHTYNDPDGQIQEVISMREKISALNHYQVLDVAHDSSFTEIKKAYFRLARKYHPDLFDRKLPQNIKEKIDDVFDRLTKCYQVLSQENSREEYDSQLREVKGGGKKDQNKLAEVKFRQGKTLYNQTRFEEAIVLLEEAVRINNDKSSYFLLLAMTQEKSAGYKRSAVKSFQRAIKLDPWSPDAYLGLGLLYKKEGMPIMAAKQFKKALNVDPDNKAAHKELNLIYPESKKKGIKNILTNFDLKDVFKKK